MKFLLAAGLALLMPVTALAQSSAGGTGGGGGGGGGTSGPYWTGQYNSTLPTFANGQVGYVTLDSNGRVIISPTTPLTVSGTVTANIGTTNGLALDSTLTTVSNSTVFISSATGATSDAATAAGANTTVIGALKAIRDRLLGTLNAALVAGTAIIGKVGIDQTTPGTTNGVVVNSSTLPAGAASAANQNTEIASLAAIQQRAVTFAEQSAASLAASGVQTGTSRDVGAAPLYTKFNAVIASNQNGTLFLQGSNDNFTTLVGLGSVAVSSGVPAYITAPVMFRYNREVFANANTTTAATISINTSYTAN
jgi:hypothetical protein